MISKHDWSREAHKTRVLAPGDVLMVRSPVIDITPQPDRLVNRKVTRELLEAHHARRTQAIEQRSLLEALNAANEALAPVAQSWWARLARWMRRR